MRKITILAALALALALPGATFAASVSAQSAESVTILDNITLTGIPASYQYPDTTSGTTSDPGPTFAPAFGTSSANGLTLSVTATDLTGTNGQIGANAHRFKLIASNCGTCVQFTDGAAYGTAGSSFALYKSSSPSQTASGAFTFALQLAVPATVRGGAYTGTLTFSAIANP